MTETAPSPLLGLPGAVADEGGIAAWHYGQPLAEQRTAIERGAVFDRSDRDVITITGAPRLEWLHSLSTQHLTSLKPFEGTETLFLSPTGRIEHHANVFDDGETVWLDTEPGAGEALLKFLQLMKFRTEVDIVDATGEWALLTVTLGAEDSSPEPVHQPVPVAKFAAKDLAAVPTAVLPGKAVPDMGWIRRTDALGVHTVDWMVPRDDSLPGTVEQMEQAPAGSWAFDALRVAAKLPRFGVDTDEKTVPHEVAAWLASAVHLDKGCYRGQETVAKVHHLGQPPRRLVRLHLDGSTEPPPAHGTPVTLGEKEIGSIGTAVQHYEDGQIALALLKRSAAEKPDQEFETGGQTAVQ
ncbi:YgfZ/GcvT domain-containing protein [Glycomyces buryatensis]|uniref:Folate-binding protein YgfZ n=1 Tax=Glycomyces buryatensis TaxID=2570927 RepID=A0A4S8QAW5_9ACTN|nr:folate-binding protein YgfZ [Glycomyces buryatensis]THV40651.1 folate-binding protein YgfZ [Glycomyces buryatensis]